MVRPVGITTAAGPGFEPIDPRGVPGSPDRPLGPRMPYPVKDPADPIGPASEPDDLPPGGPAAAMPRPED